MGNDFEELRARVGRWIEEDPDSTTRDELRALLAQPDISATDLADRFAGTLEFGTAGLRGVLAAGPNRMNRAVVARTTWGLAQELLRAIPQASRRGVVVGGDARRMSREFAEDAASILAAAGISVLRFERPVPTPLVAFAVKHMGAAAGVVVTASHNPPEYNGYKVYWENAAQIIPPVDGHIASAIAAAPPASQIEKVSLEVARSAGLLREDLEDVREAYLEGVQRLAIHPFEGQRDLPIVYTPLHGVGDSLVRAALARSGFERVTSVPEQQEPDGSFPTVAFPNPEEPGAMVRAFECARRTGAKLVLANDPDADRLAVAIRVGDAYRQLSGNEVGVLLGNYLLTQGAPSPQRAVVASLVSSPWLGRIATGLGVRYEETLTGFKWIANRAMDLEREGYEVIFGYEEALGYSVGSLVRDKDGISAALLVAELAAVLDARGMTLDDALAETARRWGYFASAQLSVTRKGAGGVEAIRAIMDALRRSPPLRIAGAMVLGLADYAAGHKTQRSGLSSPLLLPRSNVLALDLEGDARILARPSGTEPKIKFYFDVAEAVAPGESAATARQRALGRIAAIEEEFVAAVPGVADGTT